VLRRLGQLLRASFQNQDVVGRWGGGEFVVGMHGLGRADGVQRLAEVLESLREEKFGPATGSEFRVTFSAAVAEYPEDASDLQFLYRAAEETIRQAETAGGNRVLPAGWRADLREKLRNVDVALGMHDEAQTSLLLHSLETRGYRVRWIRDSKSATRALAGSDPDLRAKVIVLDEDLPGDGLELLRRFARDGTLGRSRVIMLTAPSVDNAVEAAVELGAFAHVAKPFSLPVLLSQIRRAFELDALHRRAAWSGRQ